MDRLDGWAVGAGWMNGRMNAVVGNGWMGPMVGMDGWVPWWEWMDGSHGGNLIFTRTAAIPPD